MVATDSYRLSVKETPLESSAPELEAIIPARALQELSRLAAGESIELGVQENHVVFGTTLPGGGQAWLTTRRIDGQFPNYRQLLPESFEIELQVSRTELHDVVRRVSVMAQRNSPLRLRFAEGELTVSAQTQDVGEARESMPVPYTGEEFTIGFNADFLREGVDSISGDDVLVKLINPLRPAILVDPAGDFTYLIMPIRLAG
jgi:DNA polymerase-3 subunit beta